MTFDYLLRFLDVRPIGERYLYVQAEATAGFSYKAGQHVALQFQDSQGTFERYYSIASAPVNHASRLEFCLQTSDDRVAHVMKDWQFIKHVPLSKARGTFSLDETHRQITCVAGGSGIAPLRAFIFQRLKDWSNGDSLHLIFGNRNIRSAPFAKELHQLANDEQAAGKDFRVELCLEEGSEPYSIQGNVMATVEKHLDPSRHYYLCGPKPMLDAAIALLALNKITREFVHFEVFS